MRPLTVGQTIDSPRERVYEYLSDVSNYGAFSDHYLRDLRLERLNSRGSGASLRFQLAFPLGRQWGDLSLDALEPPHRIVARGAMGRVGRIAIECSYTLTTSGQGMTRVEYRFESSPAKPIDHLREALGMRFWLKVQSRRALRRLAAVLEGREPAAARVRAAAG
ncbi:MAG: SRPBCC family protein [Solirubrobacterales bacterium]